MKTIIKYLQPHFPRMAVGFVIKFFGTVMDLLLPYILAYIIDSIVPLKDINKILIWGLLMIGCAFGALAGNVIANRMASAVARDTTYQVRKDLFGKISALSCSQVDDISESSLISRMTSDTYNIHNAVGRIQRLGVRAPILLIGGICLTMTLDMALALILVATLPFLAVTVYFVTKKGIPLYTSHQQAVDKMVGKVRESISGIRVIKALSKIDYEMEQFNNNNEDVSAREEKAGVIMAITNPVMNFLLNMGWVMIIIVGAYRVNLGLTQPGTIIAFLTYFTIILNAMLSITKIFVMMSKAGASANRIEEVLSCDEDLQVVRELAEKYEKQSNPDYISFENVSFSYNKNKPNVENISFGIRKGQTLGIIGSTGSGKSTLIQLLLRFYDVDSGCIRINGRDIRGYEKADLYKLFGTALQNDTIFEDTIKNNLDMGRDLTLEELIEGAKMAQIHDFIDSNEEKYDRMSAIKGANFSGGQKQRMLVARALAGKPEILILDDAASALDYKTDALIRNAIREKTNSTMIIVAQRVSSVMNSDRIIVLEEGQIVGIGDHKELLNKCQVYREIAELQMGSEVTA